MTTQREDTNMIADACRELAQLFEDDERTRCNVANLCGIPKDRPKRDNPYYVAGYAWVHCKIADDCEDALNAIEDFFGVEFRIAEG